MTAELVKRPEKNACEIVCNDIKQLVSPDGNEKKIFLYSCYKTAVYLFFKAIFCAFFGSKSATSQRSY
jgi:hypothetical protein